MSKDWNAFILKDLIMSQVFFIKSNNGIESTTRLLIACKISDTE